MNIFHISLNNLKRRKVQAVFLMLGLVVGVATVVAVFSIVAAMRLELGDRIDEFGANAMILPHSREVELQYGGSFVSNVAIDMQSLTEEDVPKIFESSVALFINIVSPKLIGAVTTGEQKALLVGVETQREFTQKPWFSLGEQVPGEPVDLSLLDLPEDGLLLGTSAAGALNKEVGDPLTLNGETFYVHGILNPKGTEEDGLIYTNLPAAQALLGRPGELSMIEVSAYCNMCPIDEIVAGLGEALPDSRVIALRQAALFREETIDRFSAFGFALSGVVLLIAALVVLTTMLAAVNERTREIGIFRALGFRRVHILQIIFLEAGLVSLLGGSLGYLAGSGLAVAAGPALVQLQGSIPWRPDLFLPAVLLSLLLALLASAYPALKAARLDPAEALRFM
jgi:putative ABC transport system permease protein